MCFLEAVEFSWRTSILLISALPTELVKKFYRVFHRGLYRDIQGCMGCGV